MRMSRDVTYSRAVIVAVAVMSSNSSMLPTSV
jgi:hypothetical protein